MRINFKNLEPVFSNKQGYIKYDRANKLLYWHGEGTPVIDRLVEMSEEIIRFAQKRKVICIAIDLTKANGTFTGINTYMKERFIPIMMPLGYKYAGMVTPDNPFTKFAINTMISFFTPKGLKVKMFASMTACEEWLSEQEEYKEEKA